MKTSKDNLQQIEKLYNLYENEIEILRERGIIMENTSKTYLLHSYNFVRWCRGEFTPGARNMQKV